MNIHKGRTQEKTRQPASQEVFSNEKGSEPALTLTDNRSEAIGQRTLQKKVDNSRHQKLDAIQVTNGVIQGNFPDAANAKRRENQGISTSAVQLDHMIPQATLKKFQDTMKVVARLATADKTKWEETEDAFKDVVSEAKKSQGEHHVMTEDHLVNMEKNIVPGLTNQTQGAGNEFDPQVAKSGANPAQVVQTDLSKNQLEMDALIRELNGLVGAAEDLFSKTPSDMKKGEHHNSETDVFIAGKLKDLKTLFSRMNAQTVPTYDAGMWYEYQGKKVKKRAAEWIDDPAAHNIGGGVIPAHGNVHHNFTFETKTIRFQKKEPILTPVEVNVDLDIPPETWVHIYQRHVLATFAGVKEAVNTFWKVDPHQFLTQGPGQTLLENEIAMKLKREKNFSKPYDRLAEDEEDRFDWSMSANKLFFQAGGDIKLTALEDPMNGSPKVTYDIDMQFKSIAPQDASLAWALKPDQIP